MTEEQWAVRLRSRHNGSQVVLGSRYRTRAEAEVEAKDQCDRCNYVEVIGPDVEEYRPWREQMRDQIR